MVVKYGYAIIEAETENEAIEKAENMSDGEFDWWWVSNYLTENYCDELCGQNKRHDCSKLPQCCDRFKIRFSEKEREQE